MRFRFRSTAERYAHLSEDPAAEAAEGASGAIKAAMEGENAKAVELAERNAR